MSIIANLGSRLQATGGRPTKSNYECVFVMHISRIPNFSFWYSDVAVEEKGNHIIPFLNLSDLTETTDGGAGGSSGGGPA